MSTPDEAAGPPAPLERPFLFLVVDAVPFEMARRAFDQGLLPDVVPPRRMVSVFPSLTHVAVSNILSGVFDEKPKGYEARYLDIETGEVRGGFSDPDADVTLEPLHGRLRGFIGHVSVYFLRQPLAYGQIHWITRQFLRSAAPWLAYVPATDGVGHFSGRDAMWRAFEHVCQTVAHAREEHQRRTGVRPGVVMCSDHGMAFGKLEHLSSGELEERLAEAGFDTSASGPDRALCVSYGDVGGGVVYTDESRAVEAAGVVAQAPGVDLAFGRHLDGCVVLKRLGPTGELARARIARRGGRYRYEPIHGDPLDYVVVFEQLEREGKLVDGWADDRDLLAATCRHRYPDALHRVCHGMSDIVQTPAPVLYSMLDTHTCGPPLVHLGARLIGGQIGTHGALSATQSVGFALCSEGDEPAEWSGQPALRPPDVLRPWRELVRQGSAGE